MKRANPLAIRYDGLDGCRAEDDRLGIVSVGTDVVEIDRLARVCREHGARFLNRVFTPAERRYCERRKASVEHYAGRFAAKEAILKALDSGADLGASWQEIEIHSSPSGRPEVRLVGNSLARAREMHIDRWLLSLSHSHRTAVAIAVAVSENGSASVQTDPQPVVG
ncbi:MAG: holo-ACP synthase [Planctomycetota bacterium]